MPTRVWALFFIGMSLPCPLPAVHLPTWAPRPLRADCPHRPIDARSPPARRMRPAPATAGRCVPPVASADVAIGSIPRSACFRPHPTIATLVIEGFQIPTAQTSPSISEHSCHSAFQMTCSLPHTTRGLDISSKLHIPMPSTHVVYARGAMFSS